MTTLRWPLLLLGATGCLLGGSKDSDALAPEVAGVSVASTTPDGFVYASHLVSLRGSVSDPGASPAELEVWWTARIAGVLTELGTGSVGADGTAELEVRLPQGDAEVTLHARNPASLEAEGSASVAVGRPNDRPTCTVTEPELDAVLVAGASATLAARIGDELTPVDQLLVSWASDVDGELGGAIADEDGMVSLVTGALSVGAHQLTLQVVDGAGDPCTAGVAVSVAHAPTLTLLSPDPDHVFAAVGPFEATAIVEDLGEAADVLAITWDVDGDSSTGAANTLGELAWTTPSLAAGAHLLTVTAVNSAGLEDAASVAFSVNAAPVVDGPVIEGDVVAGSTLVCVASGSDPDGPTPAVTYAWDNTTWGTGVLGTGASFVLDPGITSPEDHIRCTVTARDGVGDVSSADAEIVVVNSAPVVGVEIDPSTAVGSSAPVSCIASVFDPDGGTPERSFLWQNDDRGTSLGTANTLVLTPSTVAPGEIVRCTVTAEDALGAMGAGSASVTVDDSPPVIGDIAITPAAPHVGDTVSCSASATDPDDPSGGVVSLAYRWTTVGGVELAGGASLELTPEVTPRGTAVLCEVTATELGGTTSTGTGPVSVGNAPPTVTSVVVSPQSPVTTSTTLVCTATAEDPDVPPSLSYAWTRGDGEALGTGDTLQLDPAAVSPGDLVRCTATATDDRGAADDDVDAVAVGNSPPVVTQVSIAPTGEPIFTDHVLTCLGEAEDPDLDAVALSYRWTDTDGNELTTGAVIDLAEYPVLPDDVITCEATATDSDESGVATTSITLANRDPVISAVNVSPDTGISPVSVLTCSATVTDPDGSPPLVNYSWTDGEGVGVVAGDTLDLAGHGFTVGDSVSCNVNANDGDGGGASLSRTVFITEPSLSVSTVALTYDGEATNNSTLICTWTTSGDPLSVGAVWTNETAATVLSTAASVVLTHDSAAPGDEIRCTVTATGDIDETATGEASVELFDRRGVLAVSASVAEATVSDTIGCQTVVGDPDGQGDAWMSTIQWQSLDDGVVDTVAIGPLFTPADYNLQRGGAVFCSASVYDSQGLAGSESSDLVPLVNAPPVVEVQLSPSQPYAGDERLVCEVLSITDADGDAVTSSMSWAVDGAQVTSGAAVTSSIAGADTSPHECWSCEIDADDGEGGLATVQLSTTALQPGPADLDGNGRSDLVFLSLADNFEGLLVAWDVSSSEGDPASGALCAAAAPSSPGLGLCTGANSHTRGLAHADVDGDGWGDVISGSPVRKLAACWGSASLSWDDCTEPAPAGASEAWSLAVHDLDGDGLLDVLVATELTLSVAWNDGNRAFTWTTLITLPDQPVANGGFRYVFDLGVVDVDGDGVNDVVAAVNGSYSPQGSYVVWGAGSGRSWQLTASTLLSTGGYAAYGIDAADLDLDGAVDIVVVPYRYDAGSPVHDRAPFVYWGPITASDATVSAAEMADPTDLGGFSGVRIALLDDDPYPDVVVSQLVTADGVASDTAYLYRGVSGRSGYLTTPPEEIVTEGAGSVEIADVNGDGHPDLVFPNWEYPHGTLAEASYVYWGSSDARFASRTVVDVTGAVLVATAPRRPTPATGCSRCLSSGTKQLLVTSALYSGDLVTEAGGGFESGAAAADSLCVTEFGAGFVAMLADGADRRADIADRRDWALCPDTTYVRADGLTIGTTNSSALFDLANIETPPTATVQWPWTGLEIDWSTSSTRCGGWTTTSGSGRRGDASEVGSGIVSAGSDHACSNRRPLYCVEL